MKYLRLSTHLALVAVAYGLTFGSLAEAGGWPRAQTRCATCPQPCPTIIESTEAMPESGQAMQPGQEGAEGQPTPQAEPMETADSLDSALLGQYDVASASNFGAPNMVGDFFGAAGSLVSQRVVFQNDQYITQTFSSNSSPGTGGGVGRVKLSENTSILPQDRAYFGYQYFNSVPLTSNGVNVNRFVPGFEKTFFGGMSSVEVRVPFAGTLDASQDINAIGASNTQLGNVTLFLKTLLYSTNTFALGGGLTITTPTAPDQSLTSDGQVISKIKNQGTHLAPYMGMVWMPGRLFSQLYLQYDADATGRPVYMAGPNSTSLQKYGMFNDVSVFFLDWNAGYWVYRDTTGQSFMSGIAPIFEVHYNQALGNGDTIIGPQQRITEANDTYSIMNLTFGSHFVFGKRSTLTLAAVVPVTSGTNRGFDYEFQVLFNYYFGRLNRFSLLPTNI